jgi:hypothetical protein
MKFVLKTTLNDGAKLIYSDFQKCKREQNGRNLIHITKANARIKAT